MGYTISSITQMDNSLYFTTKEIMDIKSKYLTKQCYSKEYNSSPSFPRILKIDTCNVCNYRCIFCPQAKQINKIGNIDEELCKKIIKDSYDAGARELCVSSTGEPLLNNKLEDYISYAKNLGYEYVFMNTNGYLLDDKRTEKLIESGIDSVKISINAGRKSYQLVHGVDAYEKVIENLRNFDRMRKEKNSGVKVFVSYVAIKQTVDEIEEVKNDTSKYIDSFMYMNANNRGGSADFVTDDIYAGDDEFTYRFPCSQLFNNLYVTAEGYMVACAQDFENNMVIADLHDISVSDAWNSETFVNFRENYLKGNIKGTLCENCVNNTHKLIKPLNKKYSGYEYSVDRVEDVRNRINELVKNNKNI